MVQFEVGGEIPLRYINEVSHLCRKNLFNFLGGKEKHFRFSVDEAEGNKVKEYFKNIPCPFYAYADKQLYAFRPDLKMDETIDMSLLLSNPSSHTFVAKSERLAKNPLPMLSIVKTRKAEWI